MVADPLELIARVRADGLSLEAASGGGLEVKGPPESRDRWREELRRHKPEILKLLAPQGRAAIATLDRAKARPAPLEDEPRRSEPPLAPTAIGTDSALDLEDYYVTWAERAAIREYDGPQDRPDAEQAALGETLHAFERSGMRGQVVCGDCANFEADAAGCGGIGSCRVKGEGVGGKLPLYPRAPRFCRDYERAS